MKKCIKSPQFYCMNPLCEVLEQQILITLSDRNQNRAAHREEEEVAQVSLGGGHKGTF